MLMVFGKINSHSYIDLQTVFKEDLATNYNSLLKTSFSKTIIEIDTSIISILGLNNFNSSKKIETQVKAQELNCGLLEYSASKAYNIDGTRVLYDCKIWESKYWTQGETPGELYGAWRFIDYCSDSSSGGECSKPNFYCNAYEYDSTIPYSTGTIVYSECAIWIASRNVKNDKPGTMYGPWEYVSYCEEGAECPPPTFCGAQEYDPLMGYIANSKVYYDCLIWQNLWDIGGKTPGEDAVWISLGFCEEIPYCNIDLSLNCRVPDYNSNITYPTNGTQVYYDCKTWENRNYANPGEKPGDNSTWQYSGDCNEGVKSDGSACPTINYGYCGVQNYYPMNFYETGDLVYSNGNIYECIHDSTVNKTPESNSGNWTYIEPCTDIESTERTTLSNNNEILKTKIQLFYYNNNLYYDLTKLNGNSKVYCYDTKGSLIFSKVLLNSKNQINLSNLKQGLYFIRIINNSNMVHLRIIVV